MGQMAVVNDGFACRDEQLGQAIKLLYQQINVANHRLLKMIAEFDVRGGWKCGGTMRSCAHWMAAQLGITLGAAREKLRVARRLCELPEVDEAFAGGDLSYSKVRAITRVATPRNETLLLGLADSRDANALERIVSRYEPVPDVAIPEEAQVQALLLESGESRESAEELAREQAREMFWFQDEDGMWVIHARLPPEQGQLVVKALEAVARPIQEQRKETFERGRKERLKKGARAIAARHQAVGAVADAGAFAGDVPDEGELAAELQRVEEKISAETFSRFMNQVRADAFGQLVEHFLASAPDGRDLQGLKGAERCQVVLHVDVNTLREQRGGVCCVHGRGHFEDKPWVSAETARRLGCDASLVTVLEDDRGRVLNVGRRSRIVPANIRRALKERDGCCRFPGCSEARYVDAHHVVHWADGGETSLDNLVTLCRFHHARLHAGCFEIRVKNVSAETSGAGRPLDFEFVRAGFAGDG